MQADIVLNEEFPVKLRQHLEAKLNKYLGMEIRFEVREVNHIQPLKSGKSPTTRWAKDEVGYEENNNSG